MRFVCLLLVGCSAPVPKAPAPRIELSTTEWTARCRDRIELARLVLVRLDAAFADATLAIDNVPWNPSLRFEARNGDGYWQASVEHGRGACIDFDIDDPAAPRNNMAWRDSSSANHVLVDRIMRMAGDEAWLQANAVSTTSAIAFRRELQFALSECLLDARGVELADPPAGLCNFDEEDRCPDEPSADSDEGCPEPAPPPSQAAPPPTQSAAPDR